MNGHEGEPVEREYIEGLRYEDKFDSEVAGRCQESVYPGVCGNWLPCSDHRDHDDDGVLF